MRKPTRRQAVGDTGEAVARAYLRRQGWEVVARNWRCRGGELDIVARRGEVIAFVEVRSVSRAARQAVRPEESVGQRKQRRLSRAASQWLQHHAELDAAVRFDVIAVELSGPHDATPTVRHHTAAFEPTSLFF